jgi:hypothetical protein
MSGIEKTKLEIRGVREAKREGWRVVNTRELKGPASWTQLYDWLDQNCTGQYKESFYLQEIAFEKDRDVTWFMLKWM